MLTVARTPSIVGVLATVNTIPVAAGSYESRCDYSQETEKERKARMRDPRIKKKKCIETITLNSERIVTPNVTIPVTRVTRWNLRGSSSGAGGHAAFALLLGGPLLGAIAEKNHDYTLSVYGYDAKGLPAFMQINFKDNNQYKQIAKELRTVTGLAVGQYRSEIEIKELEDKGGKITLKTINPLRK